MFIWNLFLQVIGLVNFSITYKNKKCPFHRLWLKNLQTREIKILFFDVVSKAAFERCVVDVNWTMKQRCLFSRKLFLSEVWYNVIGSRYWISIRWTWKFAFAFDLNSVYFL